MQFGLLSLALQLLVLLINCSNLALANRVSSGQASSRITEYPNCAKPGTLAVILVMISKGNIHNILIEKLFVFGSSLYGEGKDIDILIISDDFSGMSEKARILRLKRNFTCDRIDPQCYTVSEYNRLIGESNFFKFILQEAIEIYD